jgi:hypothetical protein
MLNATAAGSVSGTPVAVVLLSLAKSSNSSDRIGSIRVTSGTGANLDSLLAAQADQLSIDTGVSIPSEPNAGYTVGAEADGPSAAELVIDSEHGLRMVSLSLARGTKLTLSGLARLLGFSWPADSSDDPVTFSAPWLYYVPNKPAAPAIDWFGKQIGDAELGVAGTVDVPALGINSTRGSLLMQPGNNLTLQVSYCSLLLARLLHVRARVCTSLLTWLHA